MAGSQFLDKVREAGVVGAGGAGFPTHVKLDAKVDWLIANAAECEPLLHADAAVLEHEGDKVIQGMIAAAEQVGATRITIAIKRKHTELIEALQAQVKGTPVELCELNDTYPAGDEHVMVYEVTGRIVPEGGIPLQAGCVVSNVETYLNVAGALDDEPVTMKYVTVNGAVTEPQTFIAPIGISLEALIRQAGGPTINDYVVVTGGCMMGRIGSVDESLTKTVNAVLVFPPDHEVVSKTKLTMTAAETQGSAACCQCWDCTKVCPRYLLGHNLQPHLTMRAMAYGKPENSDAITTAWLCCECGTCEMYCPIRLSPRRVYQGIKAMLKEAGVKNPHTNADLQARETRPYRLVPSNRLRARLNVERYNVDAPLVETPLQTAEVEIPLRMQVGAPSQPIVVVGDVVKAGQLIARIPEGALGANIHASISGKVTAVDGYIAIEA